MIALLALPYAAGDTPVGLDRPLSFLILTVIGWLGLAIRAIDLAGDQHRGPVPDARLRPVAGGRSA